MNKIRLGIIGTGRALDELHYPALCELCDKYEIVALCDIDNHKALNFAKKINLDPINVYQNYNNLLERDDIDAVDIMVPIAQNYIVSEAAAKKGKNIICEKPMAPNLDQAKNFTEIPTKYGIKVMIAENFRYNEEMNKIRQLIVSGKLGRPVYFFWNEVECFQNIMKDDTFAASEWRQHPEFRGGAFLDAALHNLAGMRHIFGPVDRVCGFGVPLKEDFNPYVSVNTNILFKTGVIGQFTYFPTGFEMQKPLIGFRIFCTNGMLYLEDKKSGIINLFYNDGTTEQIAYTPERGYYNELLNFYNAMNGIEEISVTPEIEYGDVKMVFSILKSVEKKEVVRVDSDIEDMHINDYSYLHNKPSSSEYIQ